MTEEQKGRRRAGCWLAPLLVLLAAGGSLWWLDKDRLTAARLDAMIRESLPEGSTRAEVEAWLDSLPFDTSSRFGDRCRLEVSIRGVNGKAEAFWPGQQLVTFEFEFVSLKLQRYKIQPHFAD